MSNEQAIQDVAMIARNAIDKIIEMKKQAPRDDTALLRQALDCLENHVMQRTYAGGVVIANTAIALRERLGEKD